MLSKNKKKYPPKKQNIKKNKRNKVNMIQMTFFFFFFPFQKMIKILISVNLGSRYTGKLKVSNNSYANQRK